MGSFLPRRLIMNKDEILKICKEEKVRFIRLQFTDILGINKAVEIPESQLSKALDGSIIFDGSAIKGFFRIEESDMRLLPDPNTFRIFPAEQMERGLVGRMICDVKHPDGSSFEGCPRSCFKKVLVESEQMGYSFHVGLEVEFFIFSQDSEGGATVSTRDSAGYFDLAPVDKGEEARRDMVTLLEGMDLNIAAAHHEVAPGQHEIDLQMTSGLTAADNLATFKWVVRKMAREKGLHATFMPKPLFGINGSGLHMHQAFFSRDRNLFSDPKADDGLSKVALQYIAGLLSHASGLSAITNPLVNSYKRLVPGHEAPTMVAWSETESGSLVRIPAARGVETSCEIRMPDPSCNPYLALAVILNAGLDGIRNGSSPPPPVTKDVFSMSIREKRHHRVSELPTNLLEAVQQAQKSKLIQNTLGKQIAKIYFQAKLQEWDRYTRQVHPWERESYLNVY